MNLFLRSVNLSLQTLRKAGLVLQPFQRDDPVADLEIWSNLGL